MLRGNHTTKVDAKGRLKLPSAFRSLIEEQHGSEIFVTSIAGDHVRIYPMPVWLAVERKLAEMPSSNPARGRFLERVNFFGQVASLDSQGRVVLPPILRETAAMSGEVCVLGMQSFLAVWNRQRLQDRLFEKDPFTEQDGQQLSGFGL